MKKDLIIILLILSPFIYLGFNHSNSKQGILYKLDAGLEPSGLDYWYSKPGKRIPLLATYKGDIENGKPNGIGTLTYISGNRHEGYFKDGLKHGQGWKYRVNGNRIEGDWRNGREWNVTEYDKNEDIVRKVENSLIKKVFEVLNMAEKFGGATFSDDIISISFGSLVHLFVLFCIYNLREKILKYLKKVTNPDFIIKELGEWYEKFSNPYRLGFRKYIWHIFSLFYIFSGLLFTFLYFYCLFIINFADFLASAYLIYFYYFIGLFLSPIVLMILYYDAV
jgi:hypothetical protein